MLFFVACLFSVISIKLLPNPTSGRFFSMFYSESFRVFPFMVQSLIHIKLIFKYSVYGENQNWFLSTKYPVFPVPFVEAVFPQWIVLAILSKIDWPYRWGSSLSSLFYSMAVDVCPMVVPYCLTTVSSELNFQVRRCVFSNLVFFFQYCCFYTGRPGITHELEDGLFYVLGKKLEFL